MALFFECTLSCAQKLLDTADIVREAIYQETIGISSLWGCSPPAANIQRNVNAKELTTISSLCTLRFLETTNNGENVGNKLHAYRPIRYLRSSKC